MRHSMTGALALLALAACSPESADKTPTAEIQAEAAASSPPQDQTAAPSTGWIAPTQGDLAILNVHLGMPPGQVEAALAATRHSTPDLQPYQGNETLRDVPGSDFVSWISATRTGQSPEEESSAMTAVFVGPPNANTAWQITRQVRYRDNLGPSLTAMQTAVTQQYGVPAIIQSENANPGVFAPTRLMWVLDSTGAPLAGAEQHACHLSSNAGRLWGQGQGNPPVGNVEIFKEAHEAGCARVVWAQLVHKDGVVTNYTLTITDYALSHASSVATRDYRNAFMERERQRLRQEADQRRPDL